MIFFFSCIIEKMILFGGRSAPTYHPVDKKAQNGSSRNCREEGFYVKTKVWSNVIAHKLKSNERERLGHPVVVFADVLATKKSNKCFSRRISKV